jgi:hypothetical protein
MRGRVTRLDNGQPLRRAVITLSGAGAPPSTLTDDNGRYEITGLRAASYTLMASKGGFVTLRYGQRRPNEPGRPIHLADNAVLESVNVALPRGSAITGRVFDQNGEPVVNATVQALRRRFVRGHRELTAGAGTADTTDDRGEFRVYGLSPGTYYLSASTPEPLNREPAGARSSTGPFTFYPGTSSPEAAQAVTVGLGEEIAGLSFAMTSFRLAGISGVVRSTDDRPVRRA